REDLEGFGALGQQVAFHSYETAPLEVPAAVRTSKGRIPSVIWDAVRDAALVSKDRRFRRQLASDTRLAGAQLAFEYWFPSSFAGSAFARELGIPHVLENLDPITDELRAASSSPLAGRLRLLEAARRRNAAALIVMAR